jgi:DNA-binding SARP family transcriptional activator
LRSPCHDCHLHPLRISLLGTPIVEFDGRPLDVDTRKATAMLAHLAVTGHAQSREVVAALLWPEFDIDRSRAALRRTLSTLRTALDDRFVTADRTSIALDLSDAWFDLAEFRRAAADPRADLARLAAAVDLHRGDLLDGFFIRSSAAFDDWLELAAEAIRQERAAALDRLVDALAAAGRNEEAVARAEQRLALDPLHEPAHRRLIERYAASGRRADAMRQYRECVRVLDRELGVRPLSETTELYNAVNEGRSPAVAAPAPTVTAPAQPLVGREGPWRRLSELHAGIAADGRMAVIEGESGVGKTRLADELVAALRAGGAPAIAARPSAGERGLAYGVVAQLLRAALDLDAGEPPAHAVEEAARLLPELGPPPPASLEDPGARLRFLEAVCQLVARAGAADAPGVVLVDDLHWCDPASLDALGYLARRLDGRRLLVLLTRRTDEPDPDRACARLAQLGERLPLGRLTRADVGAIAHAQGLGETEADALFAESEGLPLFLAELLAAGRPAEATPTGVREAVESRLDAVSETAAQVLSAAAVIGRTFDVDTVRTASGRSGEEVAAALEELCARGLIVERDAAYDFGHERIRAAVDDRAGLARRRLLNGRVAEALALRHGYPSLVARHLELAGREDEAAAAYATAGDRARSLSAGAEALAHYRSALALGHPDPAALHEAIGDVHTLRGEYAAALAAYDAAAAHAGEARLGTIEHKIGGVHERRGEWEPAERHLREALDRGAPAARVQADRGLVAWRRGDAGALDLCREALRLAEAEGDAEAAARAHNILGLLGAGTEHFQRSLELSEALPDPTIRIAGLNNLARARAAAGDLDPAADLVREALRLVSAQGDRHREAALRNNLADTLHRAGRDDEAMEELKRAVAIFAEVGGHEDEPQPGVWRLVEW